MPGSIEWVVKGPFGSQIKLGASGVLVVGAFLAFFHWERPAIGLLYAFLDFLTVQRWAIVFFGTTVIAAGFLLVKTSPHFKQGWRSLVTTVAILLGGILAALALFADLIDAPRWIGPSIALVQVDNTSELREPIAGLISDELRSKLNETVEFNLLSVPEDGIIRALKKVRRYQYDIVVLDFDEPTKHAGVRFAETLNPRTLYVLVRPADPTQPLPPNVLSLSPAVVEEVAALVALVGSPGRPVQVVTSGVPRARLAASLFRNALTTRRFAVGPDLEGDLRNLQLVPDQITVWIGWRPTTLPDGSVIRAPSVIIAKEGGGVDARSIRALPYLSSAVRTDEVWRQNQLLALRAIMEAHFVKSGRPLDIRVSVDAAVERLSTLHLATVSRKMRLVPRYSELGGPR